MRLFDPTLIRDAVNKYGKAVQLDQLQEEACELAVALSHYRRDRSSAKREVLSEIGDVYLMLEYDSVNESQVRTCLENLKTLCVKFGAHYRQE